MTPRFILITTAAILLVGCDRRSAEADAGKTAEIAQQRLAVQASDDKVRQLEERLNAADQLKATEREAELARVKEELAQVKRDKDLAAERIRDLQSEVDKSPPPPIAEAPARKNHRETADPRGLAVHADLERTVEEEEDREPVYVGRAVPETQRVSNVESFYEPLDEYGDWIQTDDYGYVFRPEVAQRRDWRPYTDGHWVHTGHGWTWQSNEDFGWATYHYGRWARVERAGWVWVPGREWGPGWVSWRRGNDHCGWAPLPPQSRSHVSFTATVDRDYDIGPAAYVFVALSNFGARSYAPVIERPERNVTIINKTVNVTNITYNNVTNNTVVYNGGPSYELLRARSKQPVENVQVNFMPQVPAADRRKIVNLRQGDALQVAPPPIAAAASPVPLRVKEKLGKAKEDKGWAGVDPAQAQKVKQGIAATSTERPRRPRPTAGVVNPATADPATPGVAAPATVPARPVRPVVTTPEATKPPVDLPKPPQVPPKMEPPLPTPVVEKPKPLDPDATRPRPAVEVPPKVEQPKKPADIKPPKMREPKAAAPETPPKPAQPSEPKKAVDVEPPKRRDLEPVRPNPTPEPPPKLDRSNEPKRPGDNEPRRVREVKKTANPQPVRVPPRREDTLSIPVVREQPKPSVSTEPPARPRVEAPARVKQPVEAPVRVRPTPAPEPSAPRPPQVERRKAPAPVVSAPPQPVRRVVQPDRPPQEAAPRRRENVQRQPAPAPVVQRQPVQRPPQPQVAAPSSQPQKTAEEADKKKKKKEGGE